MRLKKKSRITKIKNCYKKKKYITIEAGSAMKKGDQLFQ